MVFAGYRTAAVRVAVMGFENALVSRKLVSQDDEHVVIHEIWDLKHPECPFVSYHHIDHERPQAFRRIQLTGREFDRWNPALKD